MCPQKDNLANEEVKPKTKTELSRDIKPIELNHLDNITFKLK